MDWSGFQNIGFPSLPSFTREPESDSEKVGKAISGIGIEITGSVLQSLWKPVIATERGIRLDLSAVERGTFYIVDYDGEKYAVRLTEDGFIESYEVA